MLGIGFADHKQRALVDWSSVRALAIQSDDWGLRGFVPDAESLTDFDTERLGGTRFPPVYWRSTLEDSVDVAQLASMLLSHEGRDNLPAVFQPNMILSGQSVASPPARASDPAAWEPDPRYQRRGLGQAVADAMAAGVWHPEFHGLHHYDPQGRVLALAEADDEVHRALERGILAFPGSHSAFELGPRRSLDDVRESWAGIDRRFAEVYGYSMTSVIAGDYVWESRHEVLFRELGLRAVQAKSHQHRRDFQGPALWKRVRMAFDRSWDRLTVRDLVYLNRTALLETAQSDDPVAHRQRCLEDIRASWRRGEPAVVETHRVNYVLTDTIAAREGRNHLNRLLGDIDVFEPLYVSDAELVGLATRGFSAVRRGPVWILRNPGSATRVAILPGNGHSGQPLWRRVLIPAHATLILDDETNAMLHRDRLD